MPRSLLACVGAQDSSCRACEVAGSRMNPWIGCGQVFCSINAALLARMRRSAGFILQSVRGGWIEDESLDRLWSGVLQHKCASMQWDHAHFAWNPIVIPKGL